MSGRVIVSDAVGKRVQKMHQEGNKIILSTTVDVEDILEEAKAARNHLWNGNYRGTKETGMTRAAIIPKTIWFKLYREGTLADPEAFQRWLNENPAFKTTEGNAISQR